MTTQEKRIVPFLLLLGCSLLVTTIVWTSTMQFTPTFMTFFSSMIWTTLQIKYAPRDLTLHGILFRFVWIGLVSVGAWWASVHLHP